MNHGDRALALMREAEETLQVNDPLTAKLAIAHGDLLLDVRVTVCC